MFSNFRGENKKCFKPPPRSIRFSSHPWCQLVFFLTKNDWTHHPRSSCTEGWFDTWDLDDPLHNHASVGGVFGWFFEGNLLHQMILPCFFHVPVISTQQSSPIWPKLKQRSSILRQDSRSNMSPFYVWAVKANFLTTSSSLWQVAGGAIRCKALILAREILRWPFSKAISCSGWYRHQPW